MKVLDFVQLCLFTCELIELSSAGLPMRMPVCVE